MSVQIEWLESQQIRVPRPQKPKKITGTHFPEILGVHPYTSEFEAWCRCTRTYEIPFTGNKFTHAGEIIEPKVFDFLRRSMGFGSDLVTPKDMYGPDPFKSTYGDFFHDSKIFGGMWDALVVDKDRKPRTVVEVKTVQIDGRSGNLEERWKNGKAPDYQALQASLYAYLLEIPDVMMVCVTLKDSRGDYEHPEDVVPSFANENVYIDSFNVYERYPDFADYIKSAMKWWIYYVKTGISPQYDEKRDAEILAALRTNFLSPQTDIQSLLFEAETLKNKLNTAYAAVAEDEKRYKVVTDLLRDYAVSQFREHDKSVVLNGPAYQWTLSRTESAKINEDALKQDGLFDKYSIPTTSYRFTTKLNGGK